MKYILAKTVGKIETDAEGYAVGELKPEKAPTCDASYIAYSPDQSEVIIRCFEDTINAEEYGEELTASEAKALYEQWQNAWNTKCTCFGKTHTEATHSQLDKPCMANVFVGVCHEVIDESRSRNTKDYDEWKAKFEGRKREEFAQEAEDSVRKKKEKEIIDIANNIRTDPSIVKESLDRVIVTQQEIDAEISRIRQETMESAKYSLIKHLLKTHRVPF
jgi:hypothetical protein